MDYITHNSHELSSNNSTNQWSEVSASLMLSATTASKAAHDAGLERLQEQIAAHELTDSRKSYLQRATESLTDLFWNKDSQSLKEMRARLEGKSYSGISGLIERDKQAVQTQHEINRYSTGFLKTTALFMQGKLATTAYVGLSALDQASPSDAAGTQMADLTLGAAKAGLMRAAFTGLGKAEVGIAGRAIGLSLASQFLDNSLTRQTYMDSATGHYDLGTGVKKILSATFDPGAMATNLVVFGSAYGMTRGIDALTGGALKASPFYTTVLTGGTMGFSAGTINELQRQSANNEERNFWTAAQKGLLQGTLDGVAAIPGGIQSDPIARKQVAEIRDQFSLARWEVAALFRWSPIPLVINAPADRAYDLVEKGQLDRAHRLGKGHFEVVRRHLNTFNETSERRAESLSWAFERAGDMEKAGYYKQLLVNDRVQYDLKSRGGISDYTLAEQTRANEWMASKTTPDATIGGIRSAVQSLEKTALQAKPTVPVKQVAQSLDRYALWFANNGFGSDANQTLAYADQLWKGIPGGRDSAQVDHKLNPVIGMETTSWLFANPGTNPTTYTDAGINANIRAKLK